MKAPQHPMLVLGRVHEHEAHEGRLIEMETTGTVITQERLEALPALGFRERAPIEPLNGDLNPIEHLLHGFGDAFPEEAAAQDRMSLDDALPRANKRCFLQRLVQRRYYLLEVDAAIHSADGVEQHPRLHRRQFVGVDYVSHGTSAVARSSPSPRYCRAFSPSSATFGSSMMLRCPPMTSTIESRSPR